MARIRRFAPANFWRAFLFALALASVLRAAPPLPPASGLAQVNLPDAAETQRILAQFRRSGLANNAYVEFELQALPRRGDERVYRGKLWTGRNDEGAVYRIAIIDGDGQEHRLLLQNGNQAAVWRLADGRVTQLGVAALFAPLVPGVEIAAFDLQMPYLYWPRAEVVSVNRIRGRPAHAFMFRPPPEFAVQHPGLTAVRSYFDTQFNAPVQTELLGPDGLPTKSLSLVELKKIGEQYMPKSLDVRNEATRDKTRFLVTGIALNLDFAPALFAPAALVDDIRPPAAGKIVRIDP